MNELYILVSLDIIAIKEGVKNEGINFARFIYTNRRLQE